VRPKTIGQKLRAQNKTEQPQSRDTFSHLLNRSRPHALQLHKKISLHVADVASISPLRRSPNDNDNSTNNEAFGRNTLIRNDESTKRWIARSLNRKHLDGMGLKSVTESDGINKEEVMKLSSNSSLEILRQLEEIASGEG
jgi:Mn-containing catalase